MKTTKSLPEFSKNSVRESPVEDRVSEVDQNQVINIFVKITFNAVISITC